MKKGIVLFIEGDSEVEFYARLRDKIRQKCPKEVFGVSKFIIKKLNGYGKFKYKTERIFRNRIIVKYPDVHFSVFLCYDTDVFEFSRKPPIVWKDVEEALLESGAKNVYHIKVIKCIEDWFLKDRTSIYEYLGIKPSKKKTYSHGYDEMKNLFKSANKVYIKGKKNKDFVKVLNMDIIMKEICPLIKLICKEAGVVCNKV